MIRVFQNNKPGFSIGDYRYVCISTRAFHLRIKSFKLAINTYFENVCNYNIHVRKHRW